MGYMNIYIYTHTVSLWWCAIISILIISIINRMKNYVRDRDEFFVLLSVSIVRKNSRDSTVAYYRRRSRVASGLSAHRCGGGGRGRGNRGWGGRKRACDPTFCGGRSVGGDQIDRSAGEFYEYTYGKSSRERHRHRESNTVHTPQALFRRSVTAGVKARRRVIWPGRRA